MPEAAAAKPRSFADDLRQRSTADIERLLELRPDLLNAHVRDLGQLASVAADALSVSLALDDLTARQLAVLELLAALPDPFTRDQANAAARENITAELEDFRQRGILWGQADLHLVRFARDAFGPYPCGLAPSLVERKPLLGSWIAAPDAVVTAVDALPESARALLFDLVERGPAVEYAGAAGPLDEQQPKDDFQRLLALNLAVATGPTTVVIPREVALPLRDWRWRDLPPLPGSVEFVDRPHLDENAAARAYSTIRALDMTVSALSSRVLRISRNRTLVRADVDALAGAMRRPKVATQELLYFGIIAGLFGIDPAEPDLLTRTPQAGQWQVLPVDEQWHAIASAWLYKAGVSAIMAADGIVDPERANPRAVQDTQLLITAAFSTMASATAGSGAPHISDLEWMREIRPRLADSSHQKFVAWLEAAAHLALAVDGGAPMFSRAVQQWNKTAACEQFAHALAPETTAFYVQPDNTIVVPGRPARTVLDFISAFADIEQEDSALVARVTPASINRGLYSGLSADKILDFLNSHSQTPIGQAMTYMLEDQQRRFGNLKVVSARAVVVAADAEEITRILGDQRLRALHLRQISATVAATDADMTMVAEHLTAIGSAPTIEGNATPDDFQPAGGNWNAAVPLIPPTQDPQGHVQLLAAALTSNVSADLIGQPTGPREPMTSEGLIDRLHEAHQKQREVSMVFSNNTGELQRVHASIVHIGEGFATFYESQSGSVQTVALSRIATVD